MTSFIYLRYAVGRGKEKHLTRKLHIFPLEVLCRPKSPGTALCYSAERYVG